MEEAVMLGKRRWQVGAIAAGVGLCLAGLIGSRTIMTAAGDGPYRLVANWPQYPADMNFEMGSGIAVDSKGIVYTYTRDIDHWAGHPMVMAGAPTRYRGKGSITMFDRSGKHLGKFAPNEPLLGAHHLFIDKDGF